MKSNMLLTVAGVGVVCAIGNMCLGTEDQGVYEEFSPAQVTRTVEPLRWEGGGEEPFGSPFSQRRVRASFQRPLLPQARPTGLQKPAQLTGRRSSQAGGWRVAGEVSREGRRGLILQNEQTGESHTVWEGDTWNGLSYAGWKGAGVGGAQPVEQVAELSIGEQGLQSDVTFTLGADANAAESVVELAEASIKLNAMRLYSKQIQDEVTVSFRLHNTKEMDDAEFEGRPPNIQRVRLNFISDGGRANN